MLEFWPTYAYGGKQTSWGMIVENKWALKFKTLEAVDGNGIPSEMYECTYCHVILAANTWGDHGKLQCTTNRQDYERRLKDQKKADVQDGNKRWRIRRKKVTSSGTLP